MSSKENIVFFVDHDAAERDSLKQKIKQKAISVQTFESAESFLTAYRQDCRGCLVTDIHLPGMNGFQLQGMLRNRKNKLPIIFLSDHGTISQSVRAIKAGAIDFLVKPVPLEKFFASIQAAFVECEKLMLADRQNRKFKSVLSKLTNREKEVMKLVVRGFSNKEIAAQLGISFRTVEIHRGHMMRKSGVANLLELIHLADEIGLNEYGCSN